MADEPRSHESEASSDERWNALEERQSLARALEFRTTANGGGIGLDLGGLFVLIAGLITLLAWGGNLYREPVARVPCELVHEVTRARMMM